MTGFKRPAVAFFAAGMIVAFAISQAGAQPVNPVPTPPPPSFNPSTPSIVPQTPEAPVSPSAPGGLSGSSSAPGSVVVAPPASVNRQTTDTSTEPSPSRAHVHHHASVGSAGTETTADTPLCAWRALRTIRAWASFIRRTSIPAISGRTGGMPRDI